MKFKGKKGLIIPLFFIIINIVLGWNVYIAPPFTKVIAKIILLMLIDSLIIDMMVRNYVILSENEMVIRLGIFKQTLPCSSYHIERLKKRTTEPVGFIVRWLT